jgi:hypothetical protein
MNGRFADPEMVVASKPWPEKSKLRRLRAVARTAAQGRTAPFRSEVSEVQNGAQAPSASSGAAWPSTRQR